MKNEVFFSWSYPAEKIGLAKDSLAKSFAPNWQRMHAAMMHLIMLLPAHFPDQTIYHRVEKLRRQATKAGPVVIGEKVVQGALENTLRRSKRVTFERLASEIIDIDNEITRLRGDYIP